METAYGMIYSDNVYMDFGNSRVKLLHNGGILSIPYSQTDIKVVLEQYISSGQNIIYSTVNKPQSDRILELLAQYKSKSYDIEEFLTQQTYVDFSLTEGVGNDRKLGILGALSFISPPLLTIDCGTMITMNVINESASFLGGAIMPGFSTMLQATHYYTAALPLLTSMIPEQSIGTNTHEAIKNGIYSAGIGGVLFFLERLKNNGIIHSTYSIVITGGEGKVLHEALSGNVPYPLYYNQDLVLKGIVFCSKQSTVL